MDYTSTLETLEGLSNALARHFAHHVRAWEILYAFVKVTESQKLLMVVNKAPCQKDALHKYSRDPWKFLESFIHVFRTPSRSFGDPLPIS